LLWRFLGCLFGLPWRLRRHTAIFMVPSTNSFQALTHLCRLFRCVHKTAPSPADTTVTTCKGWTYKLTFRAIIGRKGRQLDNKLVATLGSGAARILKFESL